MENDSPELTTEKDKFYDYRLMEYRPLINFSDKLRSINLLFNSFKYANCKNEFFNYVRLLQNYFGIKRTIWGIKKVNNTITWEFYFCNLNRNQKKIHVSNVLDLSKSYFSPWIELYLRIGQFRVPGLLRWPLTALVKLWQMPALWIETFKTKSRSRFYEWKK